MGERTWFRLGRKESGLRLREGVRCDAREFFWEGWIGFGMKSWVGDLRGPDDEVSALDVDGSALIIRLHPSS